MAAPEADDPTYLDGATLWELVERRAEATPDATMVIDEAGRHLTFGDYRRDALEVAAALHDSGIGDGTIVSWQLPNWMDTIVLTAALSRLGAVQNPIAPLLRQKEVGFITGQLGSDVLIVPESWRGFDYAAMGAAVGSSTPSLEVRVVDEVMPRGDPSDLPPPPAGVPFDREQPMRWVLYTSGTTSDPKGARHTDLGFATTARGMGNRMRLGPDDRNSLVFPFAHIGGIVWLFADLMVGCASIVVERFGPESVDVLSREGVTIAGAGVPFFHEYLKAQRRTPERPIFPHLKIFVGGGSTRPPGLHGELVDAFGVGMLAGYGLTEAGSCTLGDLDDSHHLQATTEGRPYPGAEVRVRDADGNIVGPGVEGELSLRGRQLMLGYVDPSLDVAFDDDRFFRTGDLGFVDQDGYVHITGRLKDIVIRKGENISAREVEDLLYLHPDIDEAVLIGLPDPETGERGCAVVVLVDPGRPVTVAGLRRFLTERGLAIHKVPEQVVIVPTLPKNVGGKVVKPSLQAELRDLPFRRTTEPASAVAGDRQET